MEDVTATRPARSVSLTRRLSPCARQLCSVLLPRMNISWADFHSVLRGCLWLPYGRWRLSSVLRCHRGINHDRPASLPVVAFIKCEWRRLGAQNTLGVKREDASGTVASERGAREGKELLGPTGGQIRSQMDVRQVCSLNKRVRRSTGVNTLMLI